MQSVADQHVLFSIAGNMKLVGVCRGNKDEGMIQKHDTAFGKQSVCNTIGVLLLFCGLLEIVSKYNRLFTKQVYHVKNKLYQNCKIIHCTHFGSSTN